MKNSIILFLLFLITSSCTRHPEADLIVTGKIWTGNPDQAYAEAMAIQKDSIVAVGSLSDIEKWNGKLTKRITADKGQLIVPGFIDCHTHFVDGGFRLSSVKLRDAKSPEEFIQRIKQFATTVAPGTWITGGDWDHQNWGGLMPERDWIDSISKQNPVWINRLDGHMALANSVAIKSAGLDDNVKDVEGGTILRNKRGKITGIFKDNAQDFIDKAVSDPSNEQADKALDAAMEYVASKGVTSAHNMSGYENALIRGHDQQRLITRIYSGRPLSDWKGLNEKIKKDGQGDSWLRFGILKGFVDGSLGSHTAAFFKPFADTPVDSGFFITPEAVLYHSIKSADSAGLQVMVHAIGDKAIHVLLNIFERVAKENGPRDRRFRMEHAQHIHPNDIPRFKTLGIIASMQPYHAIDDGRFAEKSIGLERSRTTYAFKSLIDAGAIISFGSDWSVAPPTPLEGIYAAVTRRTLDDKNPNGWMPDQKITVEQALKAYTINGAYASFEENIKGSLEPGKLADFVILERDIIEIEPEKIRDVKVIATVVGGMIVYNQK